MKKTKLIMVAALSSMAITACAGNAASSETTTSATATETPVAAEASTAAEAETAPETEAAKEAPMFPVSTITPEESQSLDIIADLPDADGLARELTLVMNDLGITDKPKNFEFANAKKNGDDISLDVTMTTEICSLNFSCDYVNLTSHWIIYLVENAENHHSYWVMNGQEKYIDLYDYQTDQLISPQSDSFNTDELLDDFDKQFESISESADNALNSIVDKNNLNRPSN